MDKPKYILTQQQKDEIDEFILSRDKSLFKCSCCKKVYTRGTTEEDAQAEAKDNFGAFIPDDLAVVCDDCYYPIMTSCHP